MKLSEEEQQILLRIARDSVSAAVRGNQIPDIQPAGTRSEVLESNAGAFVTLEVNGHLRGCVGYIEGIGTLRDTVSQAAVSAALFDNRFHPVQPAELDQIMIEISVLSPFREVTDTTSIVIGEHGLIVVQGLHHGLLLPQVATEHQWNRETFLEQTCVKAGLPKGAWKWKDTVIKSFTANVFSEVSLNVGS